jgi:putative SOS response-associated peptidase YedK
MCGRYSLFIPPDELEDRFGATFEYEYERRYNAAPGQHLPVIRDDSRASITQSRWGLVPSWADEESTNLINARAETVSEKPAFRDAYQKRRCLVPADGFYEWVETDTGTNGKQPYRITRTDDEPFSMAGLWETWTPEQTQTTLDDFGDSNDGSTHSEELVTFTILTREPNDTVREYHDRMAIVLSSDEELRWLNGAPVEDLAPTPEDALYAYPVSTTVNSPSNDSPSVVEEVELSG